MRSISASCSSSVSSTQALESSSSRSTSLPPHVTEKLSWVTTSAPVSAWMRAAPPKWSKWECVMTAVWMSSVR